MLKRRVFWFTLVVALTLGSVAARASDAANLSLARDYLRQHGLDATVDLQIKELRPNLPIQSSQLEQIVGITYLKSSRTQIFRHVTAANWRQLAAKMSNVSAQQVEQYMPELLQQQTINSACSVPFTKLLLEFGLTIKHNYYEADGRFLFQTFVASKHCAKSNGAAPNNSFKAKPPRG